MPNNDSRPAFLSEEDYALLRRDKCRELTEDQFLAFRHAVERFRLDPLGNQIYFQLRMDKRSGKRVMSIQTGIDGYRLIADRTDRYAGNDDPAFDSEDNPRKATVTVYKIVGGQRCPFTATARWDQYYPGDTQGMMWKRMPHLMLGKCAEALSLRKAFPAELSGLYTTEEMEQADKDTKTSPLAPSGIPCTITGATIGDLTGKKTVAPTEGQPSAAAKTAELAKDLKQQFPEGQHGTGATGPAKPKSKTWDEVLAYTLGKITEARNAPDAMEGQALLTKVKAALPNYKFPVAMQTQVDRAVADATHAFEVGSTFDASNAPPPDWLESLENLLKGCTSITRLDEIERRWKEDKENVTDEIFNRGLELIGLSHPRMTP